MHSNQSRTAAQAHFLSPRSLRIAAERRVAYMNVNVPADAKVVDLKGRHVYPSLFPAITPLAISSTWMRLNTCPSFLMRRAVPAFSLSNTRYEPD